MIDEEADLEELARNLRPSIRFNLRGVKRINSFGVREWINRTTQKGS